MTDTRVPSLTDFRATTAKGLEDTLRLQRENDLGPGASGSPLRALYLACYLHSAAVEHENSQGIKLQTKQLHPALSSGPDQFTRRTTETLVK